MYRKILDYLQKWLVEQDRKPLVIRGARQVGKTWVVHDFAKAVGKNILLLNFEKNPQDRSLFVDNDLPKTLLALETRFSQTINPKKHILFLDEIQAAPELLAKLRWFYEDYPQLPVIAAGSLLDFALSEQQFSMPVGRIAYAYLEPMSFEEFLLAVGNEKAVEFFANYKPGESIPSALHEMFLAELREYILVGGMPEAVYNWTANRSVEERSLLAISAIQHNLLATYIDDFNKYAGNIANEYLTAVFNKVPRLLGKKFKYSNVDADVRSNVIKMALNLICKARICHKVYASSANGVPIAAESKENIFKVIFGDIGLVSALLGLNVKDLMDDAGWRLVNEGGIAEQLVGQLLRTTFPYFVDPVLYYWVRDEAGAAAEVDYLIQHHARIIPVEVKAGTGGVLRSLHSFMDIKKYNMAVRFNADKPSIQDIAVKNHRGEMVQYKLLSLPLYLIEQLPRILQILV